MANKRAAVDIVRRLQREGFEALLAGGCVRDMLLGRRPKDYDVATDALPEDVMRLFPRTLKVGAKFGVVIVLTRGRQVEVATFRCEADYKDGRHPDRVTFTNAAEDASRRDFTINGMFYNPVTDEVIDYVDGRADLERRIIRTIGRAQDRFSEDYLRMLRAIRFSTQLGFPIEPETFEAICRHAKHISKISGERIAVELETMLTHPNRQAGATLLLDSGLARTIFPGLNAECGRQAVDVFGQLRKRVDFALALATLFIGLETEEALTQCEILKLSRNRTKHIHFLLAHRGALLDDEMALARLKLLMGKPYFRDLYELERARQKAHQNSDALASLARLCQRRRGLRGVNVSPKPLLNGHELIGLGATPGPGVGLLAEELYLAQLEGQVHTPSQARQWASRWLEHHRDISGG